MRNTEAAFLWITDLVESLNIPYEIAGGFAARLYGSTRELADIDVEVPASELPRLYPLVKEYVTFGLDTYKDSEWELQLITLVYEGQEIDLAGNPVKIFNSLEKQWELVSPDFNSPNMMEVFGKQVPVITKENLIRFKSKLRREVDLQDLKALGVDV